MPASRDPSPDDLSRMAVHVDHEMWRLLDLGDILRRQLRTLPDGLSRGLRAAYAAHSRALLEFFYDGRPHQQGKRKAKHGDIDVWFSDYLNRTPGSRPWEDRDAKRLYDADKLVGHLSTGRTQRTRLANWGTRRDRRRFRGIIREIMRGVPNANSCFKRTAQALKTNRGD